MRKFVFVLGGSSVSSAMDDNLDVFNEKMGQNFNLSWVVKFFYRPLFMGLSKTPLQIPSKSTPSKTPSKKVVKIGHPKQMWS